MRDRRFARVFGADDFRPFSNADHGPISDGSGPGHREKTHQAVMPLFFKGLAEVGYEEGRNVAIEHRWAEGRQEHQPALAADLVARRMTVIAVDTMGFAQIAKTATQTIPIVVSGGGGDLIEFGLVASYNHPGGNVSGVVLQVIDISAKRLELLRKLVPATGLIAAFVGGANSQFTQNETRELQSAASVLGARLLILNVVPTYGDVAAAFSAIIEHHAGALLLSASIFFQRARDQIISLAARHGIPTMFWDSASAAAGGLSSYGPDLGGAFHQAGLYTGRILNGERPADLPVVQPTNFKLVINLKTATTLGLTIPPAMLALADDVIE